MGLDIEALRADTPDAHASPFNHAGAALPPRPVLAAVVGHLELEATIEGYEAAAHEAERLEDLYAAAASLIGARPDEIAFTDNATQAWALAAASIGLSAVTAFSSHPRSTATTCSRWARPRGGRVPRWMSWAPLTWQGARRTGRLVAMVQVAAQLGEVQPVAEVGRMARAGALFLVDAAQAVGQIPVDVGEARVRPAGRHRSEVAAGPRGTGFLYVAAGLLDRLHPPVLDNITGSRTDARRFELGKQFIAGKLGLTVALEYARSTWGSARSRPRSPIVRPGCGARSRASRDCRCAGPETGIVTFTIDGLDPVEVVTQLRQRRVNLSAIPPTFAPLRAHRARPPGVTSLPDHPDRDPRFGCRPQGSGCPLTLEEPRARGGSRG